ncbi:MAG: MFS transporter [Limimaricola sp.]|uniref:MFS transporter n=1 Tax=Limimaricola sp. TaxID=2211665 RepID=UPI001D265143|nr:MFS transporter [Limimaricola sp.]MBI1415887.1 MFS transporter [Limimaricola sp.]
MTTAPSLWRHRDFLRLWAAQAGSAVGARISRTVLPMLALLTLDASASEVSALAALSVAPGLVVGLWAGRIVDARARRPLMIGADLARAALILTVPVAAHLGALAMPQIYLVAAAVGAASALFSIAEMAYVPALVGPARIVDANARLEATDSVAEGVGPWLGGVLVQIVGGPLALAVDAASYLWSAALLGRIAMPEARPVPTSAARTHPLADLATGLKVCRDHPPLMRLLAVEAVTTLAGGVLFALYTVVALGTLGLSPAVLGLLIGAGGIGSLAGALMVGPLLRSVREDTALRLTLAAGLVLNLTVPMALLLPGLALPLLALGQVAGDAFLTAFGILALSLRQRVVADAVMGRVAATFRVTSDGCLLAGAALAGLLTLFLPLAAVIWAGTLAGLTAIAVLGRGGMSALDSPPEVP